MLASLAMALALVLVLAGTPPPAFAEKEESGPIGKFLFGIGAGVCTLAYTPLKIVYAVASLPLGGLVYMFSVGNTEMSERVWRSGTQGNWVVTPEHLQGRRNIEFVGAANEGPDPDAEQRR